MQVVIPIEKETVAMKVNILSYLISFNIFLFVAEFV